MYLQAWAARDYFKIQLWNSPMQILGTKEQKWAGRGPTFWVAPWLGTKPGWNFGVIDCVGPAPGHRTYTHTFIFI
jgi:hypothetical protein